MIMNYRKENRAIELWAESKEEVMILKRLLREAENRLQKIEIKNGIVSTRPYSWNTWFYNTFYLYVYDNYITRYFG